VLNPNTGQYEPGLDVYRSNLIRKYGSNWANTSQDVIVRRLRTWGFNTVGPSSWGPLYDSSHQIANMQETAITGTFRTITTPGGSAPMPDPFDPAWASAVSAKLGPLVAQLNTNPYNAGLFVDNELPWAQHWQNENYRYDLAYNVLSAPSSQPAKRRFYNNMLLKYRTISRLNQAWGTSYGSWVAFLNNQSFRPNNPNATLRRDMEEFLNALATQYFGTVKSKLTAFNYKGLYLGCRFAYIAPEVLSAAARYCDVISFNCYDLIPSQWRGELKTLDKPVLVGEFAFSASDRGRLASNAPCGVTEEDRVAGFNRYISDIATWPNLVGLHWYKWEDDPLTGRMWDSGTHGLGLVSITDVPYTELVAAAKQANTMLNQRLLTP
jgi:agarase